MGLWAFTKTIVFEYSFLPLIEPAVFKQISDFEFI